MKLIKLTQDQFAKVDDELFGYLNEWKWCYHHGYAIRQTWNGLHKQKHVYMHREINATPEGFETDHIDCDKLNNQKINLRTVTRSQNHMNERKQVGTTSIYKGVYYCKKRNMWRTRIFYRHKRLSLGFFTNEVEAAKTYDAKALELFGEFARVNFPPAVTP